MVRISRHFVRAEDPEKFASTLINFMGRVSLFVSTPPFFIIEKLLHLDIQDLSTFF